MPTDSGERPRSATSNSPVRVLSVPSGVRYTVLFLAGYRGLDTHRCGKSTEPCCGPPECGYCKRRQGIIWKGYAPILCWAPGEELWYPAVLEITESFEEELRGRKLRGEVWTVERKGKGRHNDPVTGQYQERKNGPILIDPFDITPVLLRVYHVSALKLDRPNTMPGKLLLPAVAGDAPSHHSDQVEPDEPQQEKPIKRPTMRELAQQQLEKQQQQNRIGQQLDQADKHESNGTSHDRR